MYETLPMSQAAKLMRQYVHKVTNHVWVRYSETVFSVPLPLWIMFTLKMHADQQKGVVISESVKIIHHAFCV